MSVTATETALMLHVEQITSGAALCDYCDKPATMTVSTGADPDPVPCCTRHSLASIGTTERMALSLFPQDE